MNMLVIQDFWEDFVDFLTISKFSFPAIYIENKYAIHVIATYTYRTLCPCEQVLQMRCYILNIVFVLF